MLIKVSVNPHHQQGAALLMSMLILLVLTLIGVSGMNSATIETKMASNYQSNRVALEAAESAVMAGEDILRNHTGQAPELAGIGVAGFDVISIALVTNRNWWSEVGKTEWANGADLKTHAQPVPRYAGLDAIKSGSRYIAALPKVAVELVNTSDSGKRDLSLGNANVKEVEESTYRITARGVGGNENSVVYIQTTYRGVWEMR